MSSAIFGASGMVGSALRRALPDTPDLHCVTREWGDLRDSSTVSRIFRQLPPLSVLYLCAARVGGIGYNISHHGSVSYDNLSIQTNVIECARIYRTRLVVFLGSSCVYPRTAPNPISESSLGTGELEPTNFAYASAKLSGIHMLKAYHQQYLMEYLVPMPCNLYGPGDNFDPERSHLVPALIRRMYEARERRLPKVTLWGTGTPSREILHVDDLAKAITLLVLDRQRGVVNIGPGIDHSVATLAKFVAGIAGYDGEITFDGDTARDGIAGKCLKIDRVKLAGWLPMSIHEGLTRAYTWYRNGEESLRRGSKLEGVA